MFDAGDLQVLTFGNCVLKTGVIKWPLKLYVRFFTLLTFFSKRDFLRFYRAMLCIRGICYGPVSVCLSVRHKSVFC